MKTKNLALLVLLLIIYNTITLSNPFFTIGSNVYYTIFGYPHDLLRWPRARAAYIIITPQTLPWQGDVTNMANRPSDSYTSTYQSVEFEIPSGYSGNPQNIRSWMDLSSYVYVNQYNVGGIYKTDIGTFLIELSKLNYDMELSSKGMARAYETQGTTTQYFMVPFDAETRTNQNLYSAQLIYANEIFNIPFGIKLTYLNKKSENPGGHLNFTDKGTAYNTSHLTWAWATFGCAKIFGYSHINSDAFFENSYTVFNGSQIDLQTSFEYNSNYKTGIRYRRLREDGDSYSWKDDPLKKNYGSYLNDPNWKDAIMDDLIRAYSKINLINFKQANAGILLFLQYDHFSKDRMNKLIESDPASRAQIHEFVLETNPFLNYKLENGYVDCGILFEVSRAYYKNTSDRYNSAAGATQKDVLWSTSPYNGWDYSWETFSKGSHWFFSTGVEINPSINVYKGLNLDLRLTVLRKFTWMEKIYGKPEVPAGSKSYSFTETNTRNNFKNETWVSGEIGFQYRNGPFDILFGFRTPLAYLLEKKTALEDGQKQLFEHQVKNTWQVQQPSSFRLQVICDFDFSKGFDF